MTIIAPWLKYRKQIEEAEKKIEHRLQEIASSALYNQGRVLEEFVKQQVDESCFYDSTGYGYNDTGREKLDCIYAKIFGAEAGIVRPHFVSGTHAIVSVFSGLLKPGDKLVSLTGPPYDTLQKALGLTGDENGLLQQRNITYKQIDLTEHVDNGELASVMDKSVKVAFIQRSRGYSSRKALTIAEIAALVAAVKEVSPETIVFVDNCYGEFVQEQEPCHVGADIVAGSLIKNPGAGLAPAGGYVAGRQALVANVAASLTAPGLGKDMGSMYGVKRLFYQGLFLAPHQVAETLKGMTLFAAVFSDLGYLVSPAWDEIRGDTVQAIRLGEDGLVKRFCRAVQSASPVDSRLVPLPAPMPGYSEEIIMAAGTFVQGASSELTADAPLRPPYDVFLQGGLTYEHAKISLGVVLSALET